MKEALYIIIYLFAVVGFYTVGSVIFIIKVEKDFQIALLKCKKCGNFRGQNKR